MALGEELTVIWGPNGAGKTNLIEALYLACTGRSCRTARERELIRFGFEAARVELLTRGSDGAHRLTVGIDARGKRLQVDGAAVAALGNSSARPLVTVFLPDRLELVKGAPALRRAHLDQLVAALWPARSQGRRLYSQALAQRNALISRIRAGRASVGSLASWDLQLARTGLELMADRKRAVAALRSRYLMACERLRLGGEVSLVYRPGSRAVDARELAEELAQHRALDLERGFTTHGPHRDELLLGLDGRRLRDYGSQGQQRLALLALLVAERELIASERGQPPLMLLDDVMSELDGERRLALIALLRGSGGQAVITTTDLEQIPGAGERSVRRIAVGGGQVLEEARAA